jgi:peptide/nickel transport system substrate-binding protein
MVADIGIDVRIRVTELGAALKQAETGEYQMFLLSWSGRADPDGNSYIFHKCRAPQNYTGYCNPALDALLDAQRATSSVEARGAIFAQAIQMLLEDSPIIYLSIADGWSRIQRGFRVIGNFQTVSFAWSASV